MNKSLKIVLIGQPGSGKGTQVDLIHKNLGLVLIPSPGDIYRDPEFRKTKWGEIVAPIIDRGEFAPNDITNQIMKEKFAILTDNGKTGFISEGYPRTMGQAEFTDKEIGIDFLINLEVPKDMIVGRLSGRRICPQCKKNYHLVTLPPKKDEICDICQVSLVQREDDKPEAITKRLDVYHQTAEPTIEYYRRQNKVIDINGNQSVEKVFEDIKQALEKYL
ncbi:MAG: nucleoside monophosphate kinase [Patescibacteria group bacterium]|nr:nucleoside monophosphate kinase [Patescibacteria group bacterium]MDD5164652.1 nucleoside monophosphate kinase [Patescibacteria group bacterium]MDD5534822.1 nucleoside monophosphate kinase [Patescibacteria group bacterium]